MVIFLRSHHTVAARTPQSTSTLHTPGSTPASARRTTTAFFQCPFCAFSTATLPHTDTLTAQDTRTANHGYNTLVRFECDFKPFMPCGKHLTVAAESRPFLALRYESRPPLPLRDSCDEDCATQGSMDDQSLCEALARYLDSRYAREFEVLANSLN